MDSVIPKLSAYPTWPLEVIASTRGRTSAAAAAVAHVEGENGARYPPRREGGPPPEADLTAKNWTSVVPSLRAQLLSFLFYIKK